MADSLKDKTWWVEPMKIFYRLSGWIILPLIVGTILGKWLDKKYDSEPWGFLGTIGVSFVVSMIGLGTQAVKEYSKITSTDLSDEHKTK